MFGDKIITAKTKEEFQDKINYYSEHIKEGLEFYKETREEILKNHTYKQRCQTILEVFCWELDQEVNQSQTKSE
jgi:spore maturation protein CgeB